MQTMSKLVDQVDLSAPLKFFYSYAHEDEPFRNEMSKAIRLLRRQGLIDEFYDRDIDAGMDWNKEISSQLQAADIIVLLISPDFIASEYCYGKEMARALERHSRGEATVVPVIVRPTDLTDAPFAHLQYLPPGSLAVSQWTDRDAAYKEIAVGVRTIVSRIKHHRAERAYQRDPANGLIEDRVLDAAVVPEIPLNEARDVAIQIRRAPSEGLRLAIEEDAKRGERTRSYSALPDDVRSSQQFSIPWSREELLRGDIDLSLRLNPPEFAVGASEKKVKVAAIRDSGVFTFLVSASREGNYFMTVEVLCRDVSLAERILKTKARIHKLPPSGPTSAEALTIASVPLHVRAVGRAASAS